MPNQTTRHNGHKPTRFGRRDACERKVGSGSESDGAAVWSGDTERRTCECSQSCSQFVPRLFPVSPIRFHSVPSIPRAFGFAI